MEDYPLVNKEYEKYFNGVFPARTCIAVKALPLNGINIKRSFSNIRV